MSSIEIVTADDPPTRHVVSRSRLCTLSRTFEDMLSLPTGTGSDESNEIVLTETYKEMELFIKLLKGEDPEDEYSVRIYEDGPKKARRERWLGLARMADKYDCPYAATIVKSTFWRLRATQPNEKDAFYFAIALEDRMLVLEICDQAIDNNWTRSVHVPQIWQERIEQSFRRRKLQLLEAFMSVRPELLTEERCLTTPACQPIALRCAWTSAVYASLQTYQLSTPFMFQMYSHLKNPPLPLCSDGIAMLVAVCRRLDDKVPRKLEFVD